MSGSLFIIIVPVRSHEFRLRLMENDVYSLPAMQLRLNDKSLNPNPDPLWDWKLDGDIVDIQGGSILTQDIMLPSSKGETLAFRIIKNGKLLLEITRDTMKLMHYGRAGLMRKMSSEVTMEKVAVTSSVNSSTSVDDKMDDAYLTELINNQFLEKHIEDTLTKFQLLNAIWDHSIDDKFSQVTFTVKASHSDHLINHLHAIGIGKKYESTLSVLSATVFTQQETRIKDLFETELDEQTGKWNNFLQSIKARLTVAQVVQDVKSNSLITFDFIVMVIVAGIIASMGLLEDSSVNLIASMLVSPLMGPIMAFTFGAMIRDMSLIKTGLLTEIVGLFLCLMIGFFFGVATQSKLFNGPWADVQNWPTAEMTGRAQLRSLIVGAGIAIPSGAGVALSILAGNAGSLVGVAISASLLPPCVNCGMFFGLALVISIKETQLGKKPFNVACKKFLDDGRDHWRNHQILYCKNAVIEFAIMGTISLCLTLLNIALIFLTGLVVLKIKEVAPYTTKNSFERFWKHDLKHARAYNKAHTGEDALLEDIDDNHVLRTAGEDYVFNQIRNRAMFRGENVVDKLRDIKSRQTIHARAASKGWFSWFGGSTSEKGREKAVPSQSLAHGMRGRGRPIP